MRLVGRSAVITGAGRGIGRAVAVAMAKEGAAVSVLDIDKENARRVAEEIERSGGRAWAYMLNVADSRSVARGMQEIVEGAGKIDILVNVAGVVGRSGALDTTDDEWRRVMAVNLDGVFYCCREALRHMVERNSGRIVNIGSIAGKRGGGLIGTTAYAVSKAGVIGLTKALAREFAGLGIHVNCVCPGLTITDMTRQIYEQNKESCLRQIPLGRPATPDDIANAVIFLASCDAEYITGETLDVDGGVTMD